MKLTQHAQIRARQRGIHGIALEIIESCGHAQRTAGGAVKMMLRKKEKTKIVCELKKIIQIMDKIQGVAMIMKDNEVLTVYKQY